MPLTRKRRPVAGGRPPVPAGSRAVTASSTLTGWAAVVTSPASRAPGSGSSRNACREISSTSARARELRAVASSVIASSRLLLPLAFGPLIT